jgi:UDP-glucuronate 4-epimerase
MEKILVTGAAGFIGFHLCKKLLSDGYVVIGIDSLNSYYDINLKLSRNEILRKNPQFIFHAINICDKEILDELFERYRFDYVVNLAAQAGVRYSIEEPYKYADSNLIGFLNILEACRRFPVKHLLYASSSSVYGRNSKIPFSVDQSTDLPVSLYAATKKANELMAYSYAHTQKIPCTGIRFFTVYGPYGRPDMAYFIFTKNIFENKPVQLYNHGNMERDFTYIDDVTDAVAAMIKIPPPGSNNGKETCHRIVNVGNHKPVELTYFVQLLEKLTGKQAVIELYPMQPGDVVSTYADTVSLRDLIGFAPNTSIERGLSQFVDWYKTYYHK